MRSCLYVISIVIVPVWMCCPARGEIVFDSITEATQFGGGVVTAPGFHGGDVVQLAGSSRIATRVDVLLYEFGAGVPGDLTFKVYFWDRVGVPGNLIWQSPAQHASLLNRTPTVVSVEVPGVRVPDLLAWTVQGISNLHSAGVVGAFPATIGTPIGQIVGPPWSYGGFPPNSGCLGFRLIAVPEPTTGVLIALGVVVLFCARTCATLHQRHR